MDIIHATQSDDMTTVKYRQVHLQVYQHRQDLRLLQYTVAVIKNIDKQRNPLQ